MIRKIVISLLLIIVTSSLLFFFLREEKKKDTEPALFLPEQTSVYLEHRDLEAFINDFRQSKLGTTLSSIDYDLLFRELQINKSYYEHFVKAQENISEFLDSQFYKQLLSEKVIITLLPAENNERGDLEVEIKKRLLIILKPKINSSLLDLIGYLNLEGTEQSSTKHGNHVIKSHHIENDGILVTSKVNELVLLSFNEDVIRQCLDRFDQGKRSLVSHNDFRELREEHNQSQIFFYSSIQSIREQLRILIQTLDDSNQNTINKGLTEWNGWRTLSFGIRTDDKAIYDKAAIFFDKDKIDPTVKKLFLIPPEENNTLSMVPPDIVTYYWTNTFDLSTIWNTAIIGSGTNTEQRKQIINEFKKNVGIKPEKLFEMIDNNIAFFIMGNSDTSFIPLPDFSFVFHLKKPKKFQSFIKNQLNRLEILVQSQTYKEKKLFYWGNAIQENLQPVYSIFKDHLYVASSVKLMKKIIDTMDSGQGLGVDPEFLAVIHSNFTKKNNSVSFVRLSSLIRLTKELINWGGTILGLQDRGVAHKSKILIEDLINPLLDGLDMFSTIHARSFTTEDRIIFESQTLFNQEKSEK